MKIINDMMKEKNSKDKRLSEILRTQLKNIRLRKILLRPSIKRKEEHSRSSKLVFTGKLGKWIGKKQLWNKNTTI